MSKETINNFCDLEAWKVGHALTIKIYTITKHFPREELYGLTSQLRRASSSITANIAEGFARYHFKDKVRFYYQARGSAAEVQNFLLLVKDLQLINEAESQELYKTAEKSCRLINGLIKSIENQKAQ